MTYHLLRFLLRTISTLPLGVLYAFSKLAYFLLYHVAGYRRNVVRKNLTESFPEKSPAEIKKIEKEFYRYFADNILEICKMGGMSAEEMGKRMKFTNIEEINDVLRSGKSVAIYLGHYANWEWISSMPLHLYPEAVAAQIYHRLRNAAFDKIMLENRAAHGATNVEMHQTARFVNEQARNKKVSIIGFIADQSPKIQDSNYFIPFLNHDTPVLTGTEKITKRYGLEAWFIDVRRIKRGYYEAEYVKICEDPRPLPDFEVTARYFNLLEQSIRRQPELYLWTHNRFKHARKQNERIEIASSC